MELVKIKSRKYLLNGKKQKKMIPKKYHKVALEIDKTTYNFEKVILQPQTRFLLEIELLKQKLKNEEPYAYELIEKKTVKEVSFVRCKFSANRYEVKFGNINVKSQREIFELAPTELVTKRFSDY